MNDQHKTPEEDLTLDEIYEILFSLGALFGNTLERFGRENYKITFPGDEDHDSWFSSEDTDAAPEDVELKETPVPDIEVPKRISESSSISAHIAQILTLLNPKVKAVFGSSAIYDILDEAVSAFGREGKTLEEKINGMPFHEACTAWIGTKRVFAVNHHHEVQQMLDLLMDNWNGFPEGLTAHFTGITETDRQNIRDYCKTLTAARSSNPVENENPAPFFTTPEAITEILSSDKLVLSTSKAARNLLAIAKAGGSVSVDVGRGVKITAQITGKDGEKLTHLSRLDYDVMEAIGQIFLENRSKEIIITPSQIFRKIVYADPDTSISETSIDAIIESLDKLITTPAKLDYTEQIEKHTRLKAKPYKERRGLLTGTLISGLHMEKRTTTYHGLTVEHAFKIYDMPMFFRYSYDINQLVTIPGVYLTGKKDTPKKKAEPQKRLTLQEAGVRRYLLERIAYTKELKENRDKRLAYRKEPIPKTFSAKYAFDSIAKDIGYEITPKRLRTLRDQTYAFMQEQVKLKNIISCDFYYIGRAISGIEITL